MDAVYKRSHLGLILLVVGLVMVVAANAIGVYVIVRGMGEVFVTVEAAGTHTFTVPAAGEYVFVRDATIQPDALGITVAPTTDNITFQTNSQARWITISKQRYLILGTVTVLDAGEFTAEISADAYPITLRYEPTAVATKGGMIFGILLIVPLVTTVIGIVVAIRNTNKRNRLMMNHMI